MGHVATRSAWREEMQARFRELATLPARWDGYQGVPVAAKNIAFAQKLVDTLSDGAPVPFIVPGAGGELQLEWHLPGMDIEIYIAVRQA